MRWLQPRFFIALLTTLLAFGNAWAGPRHGPRHAHSHAQVGIMLGVPLATPWEYRPPDYYIYPPVITVPSPPVYIEQDNDPVAAGQPLNYWWYYCQSKQNYYPYVQECPQGWQLVPPQPPNLR